MDYTIGYEVWEEKRMLGGWSSIKTKTIIVHDLPRYWVSLFDKQRKGNHVIIMAPTFSYSLDKGYFGISSTQDLRLERIDFGDFYMSALRDAHMVSPDVTYRMFLLDIWKDFKEGKQIVLTPCIPTNKEKM